MSTFRSVALCGCESRVVFAKRNHVADGLSVADISDLPALAISEALATVTGVASLRSDSHGEQAG